MNQQAGPSVSSPDARLEELGIELPALPEVAGRYVLARLANGLLFMSGQGPVLQDGTYATGKVGLDVGWEEAKGHARLTGLALLAAMRLELGSLDKVDKVVKVLGMVNAVPEFTKHPKVIDGCSELFIEVFGAQRGSHARSAVGMGSLPGNITVEIEAVLALA